MVHAAIVSPYNHLKEKIISHCHVALLDFRQHEEGGGEAFNFVMKGNKSPAHL